MSKTQQQTKAAPKGASKQQTKQQPAQPVVAVPKVDEKHPALIEDDLRVLIGTALKDPRNYRSEGAQVIEDDGPFDWTSLDKGVGHAGRAHLLREQVHRTDKAAQAAFDEMEAAQALWQEKRSEYALLMQPAITKAKVEGHDEEDADDAYAVFEKRLIKENGVRKDMFTTKKASVARGSKVLKPAIEVATNFARQVCDGYKRKGSVKVAPKRPDNLDLTVLGADAAAMVERLEATINARQ